MQIIKNGRSKEPLINEIDETSNCVAMLNNYLLFLVMRFAMNEPISSSEFLRKKIKFSLPELYTIAKSDSMSSTDNPESP